MLAIVAHHFVVNSGLPDVMMEDPLSANSIFLSLFGMWGKTGINCFVLITGYFMCTKQITLRKFLKLLLWMEFYAIVINGLFLATGYMEFTLKNAVLPLWPIWSISDSFVSCFLVFYLTIPFLNVLVRHMTQRQHKLLVLLSVVIFSVFSIVPYYTISFNYVTWFAILYFIASYLRLYPLRSERNLALWGGGTAMSVAASVASVLGIAWLQTHRGGELSLGFMYHMVSDSHKILALTTAVTSFMFFKALPMRHSKSINAVAASAFGVLLIHANSDTMRQWLWKDTLDNVGHYHAPGLWLFAFASVLGIYVVCTLIDHVRLRSIEKPLFRWLDKHCQLDKK